MKNMPTLAMPRTTNPVAIAAPTRLPPSVMRSGKGNGLASGPGSKVNFALTDAFSELLVPPQKLQGMSMAPRVTYVARPLAGRHSVEVPSESSSLIWK